MKDEHRPNRSGTTAGVAAPLEAAIESLLLPTSERASGRPPEARLLDAIESAGLASRVTVWRRASIPSGFAGQGTTWLQIRSRGEITPSPDSITGDPARTAAFGVFDAGQLGTLVYGRSAFDDGHREEREDGIEALALCASALVDAAHGAHQGTHQGTQPGQGTGPAPTLLDQLPSLLPDERRDSA